MKITLKQTQAHSGDSGIELELEIVIPADPESEIYTDGRYNAIEIIPAIASWRDDGDTIAGDEIVFHNDDGDPMTLSWEEVIASMTPNDAKILAKTLA